MHMDADLLLLLGSSGLGDGEPDLGEKLMKAFLSQLVEQGTAPARVIVMSSGIFLTTEGSPVLEQLRQLEAAGSEVLSCGTCLAYYGRTDRLAVGAPTNMADTVQAMLSAARVLRP